MSDQPDIMLKIGGTITYGNETDIQTIRIADIEIDGGSGIHRYSLQAIQDKIAHITTPDGDRFTIGRTETIESLLETAP